MSGPTQAHAGFDAVKKHEPPYTHPRFVKHENKLESLDAAGSASVAPDDGNAGQRLTQTFEMLETILLLLEPKHVLVLQRVNSCFRTTILNSPPLRRKLFLDATQPDQGPARPVLVSPYICGWDSWRRRYRLPLYFDTKSKQLTLEKGPGHRNVLFRGLGAGDPLNTALLAGYTPPPTTTLYVELSIDPLWPDSYYPNDPWGPSNEEDVLGEDSTLIDTYLTQPSTDEMRFSMYKTNGLSQYDRIYDGTPLRGGKTVREMLRALAEHGFSANRELQCKHLVPE